MQVSSPTSLREALAMLAKADTPLMPVAGGTDLLVSWHHQVKDDWKLLDLSNLHTELQPLRLTDDSLEIGALTTYWDVMSSPSVAAAFPLLAQAARQVGAIQIQTRGTWAGNIANGSPAADGVPVMMAYSATVVLESVDGVTEVPLDRYYTGYKQSVRRPDQLIRAIRLPRRTRRAEWFHKVGARSAQAISKLGVAVVHDDDGWRVVANSVAPTVLRCRALESALDGGATFGTPNEIRRLLDLDIAPIDDMRSTAQYRANVLSRLLYHWLTDSAGG
ncbi:MAG: FAD binding domain-containing protein [Planctomycetes bacterium]|nr:FAD binding domain-containing protein [Planctomycetota bacterium]